METNSIIIPRFIRKINAFIGYICFHKKTFIDRKCLCFFLFCRIHDARGVDDRQLRDIFTKYSAEQVYDFADASAAFSAALLRRKPEDAVFIVGSLYLAGEIKACLEEAEGGKNDQL